MRTKPTGASPNNCCDPDRQSTTDAHQLGIDIETAHIGAREQVGRVTHHFGAPQTHARAGHGMPWMPVGHEVLGVGQPKVACRDPDARWISGDRRAQHVRDASLREVDDRVVQLHVHARTFLRRELGAREDPIREVQRIIDACVELHLLREERPMQPKRPELAQRQFQHSRVQRNPQRTIDHRSIDQLLSHTREQQPRRGLAHGVSPSSLEPRVEIVGPDSSDCSQRTSTELRHPATPISGMVRQDRRALGHGWTLLLTECGNTRAVSAAPSVDERRESAYVEVMDGARDVAWAVTRSSGMRDQVAGDFESLVSEVAEARSTAFPRRSGYTTRTEAESADAVQLHVVRGDFEAHVVLCCDRRPGEAVLIRAVATARSLRVSAAEASGERVIRRARAISLGIGGLLCIGFCWLAAGVQMPVIGGLMLTIITASLLIGGGNLGVRIGEALAARRRWEAERVVQGDAGVQADLRRWNSLNRQLRYHRRALTRGQRGAPFRRPALT